MLQKADARSRGRLFLAFGIVIGLHNLEEGLQAARMIDFVKRHGPRFLQDFYSSLDVSRLRTNLVILSAAALLVGWLAHRRPESLGWNVLMFLLAGIMALNAVSHVGLTLRAGTYMPGAATALILVVPFSTVLLRRAWRERWLSPQS